MADVTDEVWEVGEDSLRGQLVTQRTDAQGRVTNRHLRIRLRVPPAPPGQDYLDEDVNLFTGLGGDRQGTGDGMARARMAAQAPTLFRALERVLESARLSPELEYGIRAHLHRASPDTHPMPVYQADRPRKSSWARLLEEEP